MDLKFIESILILAVILIGFLGMVIKRNLIEKLLFLGIMNSGVIGFFLNSGPRKGVLPPILKPGQTLLVESIYADPLPQALVITAVVIGFASLSLSLVFVMAISNRLHTVDGERVEKLIESERSDGT